MEENKKKLIGWGKCISSFEKLKLKEAQKLYIELINEDDITKRNLLRNRLIEGTLHVVYEFIEVSKFIYFKSIKFDIEDIINLCCESWINIIDSGKLLSVNSFSMLFRFIYGNLNVEFANDRYFFKNYTALSYEDFFELFISFIRINDKGLDISYNNFIIYISNLKEKNSKYINITDYKILTIFRLFNGIYNACLNESYSIELSKTRMIDLRNILLSIGIESFIKNIDNIELADYQLEKFENDIICERFSNEIFNMNFLTEKQKDILIRRFGFFGREQEYFPTIAEDYNLVPESIRQYENRALNKILKKVDCSKYKDILL